MADIKLLKKYIDESGMTMTAISEKSGINRVTLYNRLNGVGEFTVSEVVGLVEALRLKKPDRDKIFLS
jgi:predicted transcriptional regulator